MPRLNKFVNRQEWIVNVFALIGAVVVLYFSLGVFAQVGLDVVREAISGLNKTITIENVHAGFSVREEDENDAPEQSGGETSSTQPDGIAVGETLSLEEQIKEEIRRVFVEDPETAVAIATAENRGFVPEQVGDKHLVCDPKIKHFCERDGKAYGTSYGIFQIRYLPGRPEPEELSDWKFNIQYAHQIYQRSGWLPWSTFKNDSYLKFL